MQQKVLCRACPLPLHLPLPAPALPPGLLTQAGAMGLSAISSVTGATLPGASGDPSKDRLVAYLTTLATYPTMYLQLTAASAAEGLRPAGDASARQLADLPEGRALLGLER